MKATFGILHHVLPVDSRKRFDLLSVCIHLLDLWTELVGLNEIRTVHESQGESHLRSQLTSDKLPFSKLQGVTDLLPDENRYLEATSVFTRNIDSTSGSESSFVQALFAR